MKYAHIISTVVSTPWAILDAKFDAIVSVLARCEAGEKYSEEQIREVAGPQKISANAQPYVVDEDGKVFRTRVHVDDEDGNVTTTSCYQAASSGGARGKLTAVIPVYGILMPRAADFDMSEYGTSIEGLRKQFRAALDNSDVKTILFNFDSPGGSVYHIDEFATEIFQAGEQKKIIAQIDPLAASAAYYLAAQCSEIVVTPSGEVGSIGVRAMHQDISKALEQRGVKITNISAGKYKTEGNPYEPLSEEGLAFMQQRVNEYYDMFVKAVARGREEKVSVVKSEFGEGRVFGASEAKSRGMVDRVATLDETLQRIGAGAASSRVPMSGSSATVEVPSKEFAAQFTHGTGVNPATAENSSTEVQTMDETTGTQAAAAATTVREAGAKEADRIARINQLASLHGLQAKASKWISEGTTVEAVQDQILVALKPLAIAQPPAERGTVEVMAEEHEKLEKAHPGALFGRTLRAMAGAKKFNMTAARFAANVLRDPVLGNRFSATADPQDASSLAGGGFVIPDNVMPGVIELLRPKAVVRSLNPVLAPLVNGQLTLQKMTSGVTATYQGENKPITPSKVKGGAVKATAKKLPILVPISNDLLRFASLSADTMVRDDGIRALAQVEDVSFIRAAGSQYSPKGIRNWAATSFAANATINLANVTADLNKAITTLEEFNVGLDRCGWIFAPRTKGYLFQVRDGNGNYAFKDEMSRGLLLGYPFRRTSQVPKNLGTGADESEIIFADFADVVICDAPQIAVETSIEAAYDDGSGTLTSAFSNDQTVIRMIVEHDLVMRHTESAVLITAVKWA